MDDMASATTSNLERFRGAIEATLARHAGEAPDAIAVADALAATWHQVVVLLEPVIGVRGIDAIFRRSLFLTSITCTWLVFDEESGDNVALFAGFKACLVARNADDASEAARALLVNFTELLATLIGPSLTERLLVPVWAAPDAPMKREAAL
jgi:hypothetical protein